jgi:hypothetical protein
MAKSRRRHARPHPVHPLAFGGWGEYQAWADHDFVAKPADPEPVSPEPEPEPGPAEPGEPEEAAKEEADVVQDVDDVADTVPHPALPPGDEPVGDLSFTMARPYVRTGGRARAAYDLRIETMLSATRTGAARGTPMSTDHRLMCDLCDVPRSVAEIAAHLQAPLGVARVLIGDAVTANLLTLHEPEHAGGGRPSIELMRRVHDGLRRLD